MEEQAKTVRFWRGTREEYNNLDLKDSNTYYTVKEPDGRWTSFYGPRRVFGRSGQLYPVKKDFTETEVNKLDKTKFEGLGDENGILVKEPNGNYCIAVLNSLDGPIERLSLAEGVSVRVGTKNYKSMMVVDGKLMTYDDVYCGEY